VVVSYNALDEVEAAIERWPGQVAAIIVEPVAGNMGVVPPSPGFLAGLRQLTANDGSLLIFDEVITGFRVARGGAQELYGVSPDLTCLGKVLGGGLPIGAYGGRPAIMEQVAPAGPVYQAGTLSGNPLAVAAGLATLDALDDHAYRQLEGAGARVAAGLQSAAAAAGIPLTVNRVGSMLTPFFTDQAVRDYAGARRADTALFASWFQRLLKKGVSIPPAQFEASFVSTAHDEEALAFLLSVLGESFTGLRPAVARG
jgi:glutamate-1-semialdehyde 2,1-aminomutase